MKAFEITKDGYTVEVNDLASATEYTISKGAYSIVAQLTTDERDSEVSAYMTDEYGTEELFAVSFVGRFELISAIKETRYEFEYVHTYKQAREPITALLTAFEQWARARAKFYE